MKLVSYGLLVLLIMNGCHNHGKQNKSDNNNETDSVKKFNDSNIIRYKKINTKAWQKKTMRDYFVLIPPDYLFDYKYADSTSDTATGRIIGSNLIISIGKGAYRLRVDTDDNENCLLLDTVNTFIRRIWTLTDKNNKESWSCIYWDTASYTIIKGTYFGVYMHVKNWTPNQIDTIMAIYQSVGKR